ncbi:MAG: radical SAM family heme chaperone HemW [Tenacibaculum sp.]
MAGIYLHIPFCKQACSYCDFYFSTSLKNKDKLISCLLKELAMRKEELQDTEVESIYFGGGTPSILSIDEIQSLLAAIYNNYMVVKTPEITLEANPDDLSKRKIKELAQSDINRLSIGAQSFFNQDLALMNRAHNAKDIIKCLAEASTYFYNINVDLIYGIPNMSKSRWKQNLAEVFNFDIQHISSYALTIEPHTILKNMIEKGKCPTPDDDKSKKQFELLIEQTTKKGFVHYEISSFAKSGFFSKHNTSYWLGKKYLGIGPSAHSFSKTHRSWNISNNTKYICAIEQGKRACTSEKLSLKNKFNELIMLGLRTIWGVPLTEIKNNYGDDLYNNLLSSAQKFIDQQLLVINIDSNGKEYLKTAQKARFLADGLASSLFVV